MEAAAIPAEGIEARLRLLGQGWPALLEDLVRWRSDGGAAGPVEPALPPLWVPHRQSDLLLHCQEPAPVLDRLASLEPGRRVLHLFHSPGQFLRLLSRRGIEPAIVDPRWVPWLMLPLAEARHARERCEAEHPREWPWPLLRLGDSELGPSREAARRLAGELGSVVGTLARRLGRRLSEGSYRDRPDPGEVLRRGERPLRALVAAFAISKYQRHCARDVRDGLSSLGVEAHLELLDFDPSVYVSLLEAVGGRDPDLLFLIGRGRESMVELPATLGVVSWDQDDGLARHAGYARGRSARDRLLVLLEPWREAAVGLGVPPGAVRHLDLGANPRVFHPPAGPVGPVHDVLFVGNYYPFETYMEELGAASAPEPQRRFHRLARERLREWMLAAPDGTPHCLPDLDAMLARVASECGLAARRGDPAWRELAWFVRQRIAHPLLREVYLAALSGFRLGLHGSGWDRLPALARWARGPIENGPELLEAIHRSAVVLQLHHWPSSHPRLYDTAAAGGLLLVSRAPEEGLLRRAFEPGVEVDTFGSIPEMLRRIRHHLAHPEGRALMAERAAARVRREHTMEARMGEVLGFLRASASPVG